MQIKKKIITKKDVGKVFSIIDEKERAEITDAGISIVIINDEKGKYLDDCFKSIFAQTFQNFEVLFSDDCSSDQSIKIAQKYNKAYPDKVFISRNGFKRGEAHTFHSAWVNIRKPLFICLKPNTILKEDFLEKISKPFIEDQNLGFLMVNSFSIDDNGNFIHKKPFFKHDVKFFPPQFVKILLYKPVIDSFSQIVYRKQIVEESAIARGKIIPEKNYINRIVNTHISFRYPIIYLTEPLVGLRNNNMVNNTPSPDLEEIIVNYCFNIDIIEQNLSEGNNIDITQELDIGLSKLSKDAFANSIKCIMEKDYKLAKKYFHLSLAIKPERYKDKNTKIIEDCIYKKKSKDLSYLIREYASLKDSLNEVNFAQKI